MPPYDVSQIRADFPILAHPHHADVPLIYLDNGATSQKPQVVLDAMTHFYTHTNANVHRGLHKLSEESTAAYEAVRHKVARFINAGSWREIIFTHGTTESINLVAQSWGRANLKPGHIILSTVMEHHANIVPWQLLAKELGCEVQYVNIHPDGTLDLDRVDAILRTGKVRLLTVAHVSNVLGTVNPIQQLTYMAHAVGAVILVDGAQAVSHQAVDVSALGVDFYAFSGHKMCGPTGVGVLYGRRTLLELMPPWIGGGDMIERVTLEGSTYAPPPARFEAGTPPIAEVIGLGAAIDYLTGIGMSAIHAHLSQLTAYALGWLVDVSGVHGVGRAPKRGPVVSFTMDGLHPHDIAQLLDAQGIAVRAGHHCAMPLHTALGLNATVRASLALYTNRAEIDAFAHALEELSYVYAR